MKKVLLVVPDGSEDIEVAAFVEILNWTKVVDVEEVEVTIAGWEEKIKLFHGMTVIPDVIIDEVKIDEYDALAIPGGWPDTKYFQQCQSDLMLNIIKRVHANGGIIATMCFGSLAVGEAGLLKGVKGTSFANDCCEMCKKVKEKVISYGTDFQEKSIVVDNNIISNLGPAVADETALKLVEMLIGEDATMTIAETLMYGLVAPEELRWTCPVSKEKQKTCFNTGTGKCCKG